MIIQLYANCKSSDFEYLNYLRINSGVTPLNYNSLLEKSSNNHIVYMINNKEIGHEQEQNKKYFTGLSSMERANFVGYGNTKKQEAINSGIKGMFQVTNGETISIGVETCKDSINELLKAIYHRFVLLDPDFTDIGSSYYFGKEMDIPHYYVYNLGGLVSPKKTGYMSIYPFDNQNNIPIIFNPQEEIPNPLPKINTLVGYPISVIISNKLKVDIQQFQLFDNNQPIEVYQIFDLYGKNKYSLIPVNPLKLNHTYKVIFVATINNKNIYKIWTFKTQN